MAQMVLSRVGAALGSKIAPQFLKSVGRTLGRTAGSAVGKWLDGALFGEQRRIEGARLDALHLQTSQEGASVPLVFGAARLAGQVIWAARFKEMQSERRVGGKGGARVTDYTYSLSFAVGICAGEIARIGRVWANGALMDLGKTAHRVYVGSEDQDVDPLIEAIDGADAAPAFRGLAYIVFEDLPLDPFGNAVPQLSFEIIAKSDVRADSLESRAQGVCMIPASGEFVYAPSPVRRVIGPGEEASENAHASEEQADFVVSLEHLQSDLPNAASVSLAVAWFGDDLRCGVCTIRPGIERIDKATYGEVWRAGGVSRTEAHLVSTHEGAPAYGGSPSDVSVVGAIGALKARGLSVGLNPFLLMDIPAENPASQPAYPWRGRISCEPPNADKSAAARTQIDAFFGAAQASHFVVHGEVSYIGPAEWSYRRFVLHLAHLAASAGGVDFFLLGSELRGLTTVRDGAGAFPAVEQLIALAAEVRSVLPEAKITYGADWSEYFGHQPQDGSGDVLFHLDALWADANVDAIGVDWYAPLTDWREGAAHADRAIGETPYDRAYLQSRIEGGEGYDWYYASEEDRAAQVRSPITDGAYAKPHMFRPKDLRGFWGHQHHNRIAGVEEATPTAWIAKSKPIWLMELGCPAIDKGANAPNLFVDGKSAESAAPPFSTGARDDLIQRATLDAYLDYWDPEAGRNPISPLYEAPMLDMARVHLWCWDARPYPHFPALRNVWADAEAWRLGHWLNGRAGASSLGEAVREICARGGVENVDVSRLRGLLSGLIVDAPTTIREALRPLMLIYGFDTVERAGVLLFLPRGEGAAIPIGRAECLDADAWRTERPAAAERPSEVRLRFLDGARDYALGTASARRLDAIDRNVASFDAALVLDSAMAEVAAGALLTSLRAEAERAEIALPPGRLGFEPGDLAALEVGGETRTYRIVRIRDGAVRRLELVRQAEAAPLLARGIFPGASAAGLLPRPQLVLLDLPPLPGAEAHEGIWAAVAAWPWPRGGFELHAGADPAAARLRGTAPKQARIGALLDPLPPGPAGRWDDATAVRIRLRGGLASVSESAALGGTNTFAIARAEGGWEIVTAAQAVLVGPDEYALSRLLRSLQGSRPDDADPAPAGALVVALDDSLARLPVEPFERGAALHVIATPAGLGRGDPAAASAAAPAGDLWARPFAPAQLRAMRLAGGDVRISWLRCARLGGDAWAGEPPLGEEAESYRLQILSGGAPVRTFETSAPEQIYALTDQIADFGSPPTEIRVVCLQISARFGAGRVRDSLLQL